MGGRSSRPSGNVVRNTGGTAASCAGHQNDINRWEAEMLKYMNQIFALQREIADWEKRLADKEKELGTAEQRRKMMDLRLTEMKTALRLGILRLMSERKLDVVIPNEETQRYSYLSYNRNYVIELDAPTETPTPVRDSPERAPLPRRPPPPPSGGLGSAPGPGPVPPPPDSRILNYGESILIKAMASRWGGHDGYLSPCDTAGGGCGINVALRNEASYAGFGGPESKLRDWVIQGLSKEVGTPVRYGDTVRIKATASKWAGHDGFLSPCGGAGGCGVNVSLRTDQSYQAYKNDSSKLRDWVILGGRPGDPIKTGDVVEIKAMASGFAGHNLYLSPCGNTGTACGVNVTLRPDDEFYKHEPGSMLRKWTLMRA